MEQWMEYLSSPLPLSCRFAILGLHLLNLEYGGRIHRLFLASPYLDAVEAAFTTTLLHDSTLPLLRR
jgi:hypothetical protein